MDRHECKCKQHLLFAYRTEAVCVGITYACIAVFLCCYRFSVNEDLYITTFVWTFKPPVTQKIRHFGIYVIQCRTFECSVNQ